MKIFPNLPAKIIFSSTIPMIALVFLVISPLSYSNTEQEVISINAIDWCPQICIDKDRPGYVVELVREVFKGTGYTLDITIYPWSRAIRNVSQGKAYALLSPAKSEAPNLLYPTLEVGFQQMCFFTLKGSKWKYTGIKSLKGVHVGIAIDTSIEELNDYVKNNPKQFQFQPYHERYVAQNLAKLKKNRMDTFLFTKNTTNFIISTLSKSAEYKVAGCVSKAPIYMAFSPSIENRDKIEQIIKVFDARLADLTKNAFLVDLYKKYNLI